MNSDQIFQNSATNENSDELLNISLNIKTIQDESYSISTNREKTILHLKALIKNCTSVEESRQRLIYKGKVLLDQMTMKDYNIEDGHTVHLVIRPLNTTSTGNDNNQPIPNQVNSSQSNAEAVQNNSRNDVHSIEHIRQGFLSLHSIISTVDQSNFYNNSRQQSQEGKDHIYEPNVNGPSNINSNTTVNGATRDEEMNAYEIPTNNRHFFKGQWVDVKDTVSQWLEATVLDIDYAIRKVFVHYNGWPVRWDEWIAFDSDRLCPFRSRTSHSSLTPHLSPSPQIMVSSAPSTGPDDLRVLLPELSHLLHTILPAIDEAAQLSIQSLNSSEGKDGSDLTSLSREISQTTGLPWDDVVRFAKQDGTIVESSSELMNRNSSGAAAFHDRNTSSSIPIPSSDSSTMGTTNSQSVNSRLRYLSRELCPILDRLGRVMADFAPHLRDLADQSSNASTSQTRSQTTTNNGNPRSFISSPSSSFEATLLSLLRDRPPSPPPMRSYRSPIVTSNRIPVVSSTSSTSNGSGIIRGIGFRGISGPMITNIDRNSHITTSNANILPSFSSLGLSGLTSSLLSAAIGETAERNPVDSNGTNIVRSSRTQTSELSEPTIRFNDETEQHADVHNSIITPISNSRLGSSTTRPSNIVRGEVHPTNAANNPSTDAITSSLHSIAARTQELSDRAATAAEYGIALNELLRSVANSTSEIMDSRRRMQAITNQIDELNQSLGNASSAQVLLSNSNPPNAMTPLNPSSPPSSNVMYKGSRITMNSHVDGGNGWSSDEENDGLDKITDENDEINFFDVRSGIPSTDAQLRTEPTVKPDICDVGSSVHGPLDTSGGNRIGDDDVMSSDDTAMDPLPLDNKDSNILRDLDPIEIATALLNLSNQSQQVADTNPEKEHNRDEDEVEESSKLRNNKSKGVVVKSEDVHGYQHDPSVKEGTEGDWSGTPSNDHKSDEKAIPKNDLPAGSSGSSSIFSRIRRL